MNIKKKTLKNIALFAFGLITAVLMLPQFFSTEASASPRYACNPRVCTRCCNNQTGRCEKCGGDDDPAPVYKPPVLSWVVDCSFGLNDWCINEPPVLTVTAIDPQKFPVTIQITNPNQTCAPGIQPCAVILPEGEGTVSLMAVSGTSGKTDTDTFIRRYDPHKPQIETTMSGGTEARGWYRAEVTLTANASDAISGLNTLQINGASAAPLSLGEGIHQIQVTASDQAGNFAEENLVVQVDLTTPQVNAGIQAKTGADGWYTSDVEYQVRATDNLSGPQYGEYRVDGGVWVVGMNFTVSGDGTHTVEYRAFDNAGNVAERSETIQIDTTPPIVNFLAPSQNTPVDKTAQLRGEAFDSTSGLRRVEVSVDEGRTWERVANGAWDYDWNVSSLPNSIRRVLLRAVDVAGNVSQAELPLNVVTAGPFVNLSDAWMLNEAGLLSVTPNLYRVESVRIVVTNADGVVMMEESAAGSDIPSIVWWDGMYNGELQPAGVYAVSVVACDVYGKCTAARSAIEIPFFQYIFPPKVETPEVKAGIPDAAVPAAKPPEVKRIPAAVHADALKPPQSALFLTAICCMLLLFLFLLLFDPRPRALRRLALTIQEKYTEKK